MPTETTLELSNEYDAEMAQRRVDPVFDRAMDAFWRTYHTAPTNGAWRCVRAALEAANGKG